MLAKKLCTITNVLRAVVIIYVIAYVIIYVIIYVIAILSQLSLFFDKHFQAVTVPSLVHGPNVTVVRLTAS